MSTGNYVRDVHYSVLGPLRVLREGEELPLGGRQQRLVLAFLIAARGRLASTASLIDDLWGEDEPATAKKTLQGYVHHLRQQLGDALKTESGGYSIDTGGNVDALEFESLRDEGRRVLQTDPHTASTLFHDALGLWTGSAYADLDGNLALGPEVSRLADLRVAVLGDRIDADLACGGQDGLIGELEGVTQEYPLQERFRAQHMLALYRAGRQVEALRAFERTRRFLADEMGLEPSSELRQLEQRILSGDDDLLLEGGGDADGPSAVKGYELRELVATKDSRETYRAYQRSVGRQVTVDVLGPDIADDPLFIANYLNDTQRVAALEHPNLAFVFDTWREPGRAYMVSRWFGGGSLAARLEEGDLSRVALMAAIDQVGDAIAYAHRQGVVHGAIDPSNVMLDDGGHAYLAGFVVGSGESAEASVDRLAFASLAHLILTGREPIRKDGLVTADLLHARLPTSVETVFDVAFGASEDAYQRIEDFLRALRQALGTDSVRPVETAPAPPTLIRNPYKGLRAFQEGDAADFYGRDQLIDRLSDLLEANRLVAIVGPSGSGKSSVVKAGLAARVRARTDGPIQLQTQMFPGAFPFEELEGALLRVGVNRDSVIDDLVSDERGLLRVLKQILPGDESEFLLVIDQFEELFTMVAEPRITKLFLSSLAAAVADPRSRLRVVITMRADFFDRPLQSPEFAALMDQGLVPISLPDRDGLAAAVAQPALSVGLDFEAGLIDRIVRDLDEQSGGLPLLQYAMTELVEQRESDVLTFSSYEEVGGVYGALGQRAEDLFQSLGPDAQEALRQAFLRMVSVDEAAKDLRRRVTQAELLATEIDEHALNEGLQLFGAHRLITFDLDPDSRARTVEVAHEALTRAWPRLDEWITDEREDLIVRRRLDEALREWMTAGEDSSYLPSGSRLAHFQDWSASTTLVLTSSERAFLEAGRDQEAQSEARTAKRRRLVLFGLVGAATVLAVVAAFALTQKQVADSQAADAETGRLGAAAESIARSDPQLGMLMAVEAWRRGETPETLGALQRAMLESAPVTGYMELQAQQLEWEADRIFALTTDGIEVLDAQSRQPTHRFDLPIAEEEVPSTLVARNSDSVLIPFAASNDGRWVGVALKGKRFALIEVDTDRVTEFELDDDATAVTFGQQNSVIGIGTADGNSHLISLRDKTEFLVVEPIDDATSWRQIPEVQHASGAEPGFEEFSFGVSALSLNSDGSLLAVSQGPRIALVSTRTREVVGEPTVTTTRNQFPFVAQSLWFHGNQLTAIGAGTLIQIDTASGDALFYSNLPTRRLDDGLFFPSVIRDRGVGQAVGLLPDGRVFLYETDAPDESEPRSIEVNYPTRAMQEISVPSEVEEGLAVSPSGNEWVVAHSEGLVFGALDYGQLLAVAAPRNWQEQATQITPRVGSTDPGSLLSIGPDGSVYASSTELAIKTDVRGREYVTRELASAGKARFAESGGLAIDPIIISEGQTALVFPGPDYSSSFSLRDFFSTFSLSPEGRFLAHDQCASGVRPTFEEPDPRCEGLGIAVVDLESREIVVELQTLIHTGTIEWRPDGKQLVQVDIDGGVHAWDSDDWQPSTRQLPLDENAQTLELRFSPDGSLLAQADFTGNVSVFDTATSERLVVLPSDSGVSPLNRPHAEGPWFSRDNSLILTSHDGTVRLWDVATGAQIGDPFPNDIEVSAGARSGDVLDLVTAVDDELLIWNLDVDSWPDIACGAAGRNMTRAEWEQFGPRDTEYRATCPQYPIED